MIDGHPRLRPLNGEPIQTDGHYVLYWMQLYRRLSHNHALDHALGLAGALGRPLVIYEGLRLDYPWASRRLHTFVLEGMRDTAAQAQALGLNYWPFVETPEQPARGLLARLAARACVVVTDDFPGFIVPAQSLALARRIAVAMVAVDANALVPLGELGRPAAAAAHFRPRLHKALPLAWTSRAKAVPEVPEVARERVEPLFPLWQPAPDVTALVHGLPLAPLAPVPDIVGGTAAGRARLQRFVSGRLKGYAALRSQPAPPDEVHASGLSPYLHFGHLSIQEVVETVLGPDWSPHRLDPAGRGKRAGFFGGDPDIDAFLDEALTWRDLGFHWHVTRHKDTQSLDQALPDWAMATLRQHASDPREAVYTLEQWEAGETHDALWNAAQRELVATGCIHNYLRMLWGKKVLEWSRTPEEAYRTLVHLNNKYALDGRDPNSYTGILWCFGLFDRPWPPERKVFGSVRYMSSANTARKFKLGRYLAWVDTLPAIADVQQGRNHDRLV